MGSTGGAAGGGPQSDSESKPKKSGGAGGAKRIACKVKAIAAAGLVVARSAASVGAQKVKAGAGTGVMWVKTQCQRRTSK
ncbi:hypothetical protein Taro_000735 [Colocasia esculenta]|uniref:Uncharacterized protein n=1 Tax=Colocasia esculenta TaxID=4460 RepID=A0A843THC2_COLES|nr:hypothetical protein [Colocasia esculenta]